MDPYYQKYLKYKQKYLELKKQEAGSELVKTDKKDDGSDIIESLNKHLAMISENDKINTESVQTLIVNVEEQKSVPEYDIENIVLLFKKLNEYFTSGIKEVESEFSKHPQVEELDSDDESGDEILTEVKMITGVKKMPDFSVINLGIFPEKIIEAIRNINSLARPKKLEIVDDLKKELKEVLPAAVGLKELKEEVKEITTDQNYSLLKEKYKKVLKAAKEVTQYFINKLKI